MNRFRPLAKVGQGSYGVVFKAEVRTTGESVRMPPRTIALQC